MEPRQTRAGEYFSPEYMMNRGDVLQLQQILGSSRSYQAAVPLPSESSFLGDVSRLARGLLPFLRCKTHRGIPKDGGARSLGA